ncbi:potassium efflux system protein [Alcanivorax sp. S71-1-4]|uniref:monovalent cation:proton antiporter-2 (CPA2) family protein n=1 Tax=Alcanivorax sp. S71-1-4 TaxID=1177159 RepID=UPI00135C153C|nr:monovalent cation:proton antiporter-2 (CPA2) family protein [Alcanivorax sp. S71-1-4]KAF0808876.1 potassium efflux system protein [Alcanivorax sp. S71-1-4]
MAVESYARELMPMVALLGTGIVAVTLFKRLGLGSVLGYLAAGLLIGPFGLALFTDPGAILHIAELGVVMFLFLIGLEMQPSKLWCMRQQIFGLGVLQVMLCGALLSGLGHYVFGLSPVVSLVAAMGFTLSSTAIVFQVLEEEGTMSTPAGQRTVSILLLEDLSIVPLLALVAFLSPGHADPDSSRLMAVITGVGAIAAMVVAGRWLLNPLFRTLANARARELMTAAALFIVLGAALLMDLSGLSMAMGAFLAGVLLSGSSFRHQLETDIEPFRGILLGLFFVGVGMSLDLSRVAADWQLILSGVIAYTAVKSLGIYLVARVTRSDHREALHRTALLGQGGEFAFVLFAAASQSGLFDATVNATYTAIVILSMVLTPVSLLLLRHLDTRPAPSLEGVEAPQNLSSGMLIIGFGRFGQVVSQTLLARNVDVTIIDVDPDQIRDATRFGFKVYYGDGTRLDVLHACGAERARAIAVCVDNPEAASRIARLVRHEFPLCRLLVRAYDRRHALTLIRDDVDFLVRETFESALVFGDAALRAMGFAENDAADTVEEVRRLDTTRFELETAGGGLEAGRGHTFGNLPQTAPLVRPQHAGKTLNDEAAALVGDESS